MAPSLHLHFTHHKCGTRWVNSIFSEVGGILGRRWASASNPDIFGGDISNYCSENDIRLLSFTNAAYGYVSENLSFRGFHVVRDPRDILVSSYFSSLKTHSSANWPELEPHRKQLERIPKDQGLLLEMAFIVDVFEALDTWCYEDSRILEVKMEDLMKDNYSGFLKIFSHLGLIDEGDRSTSSVAVQFGDQVRLLRNRFAEKSAFLRWLAAYPGRVSVLQLLGIVHRHRFSAKAGGRKPGREDQGSHYRKGVAGDWRNHFTPEIEREFKARHGDLVVKMGYETDTNWSVDASC